MKKIPPLAVFLALFFSQGAFCFEPAQEKFHENGVWVSRPAPSDVFLVQNLEAGRVASVEDYAAWLKTRFQYRKHASEDNESRPEETLARGYGNCRDFAFLNAAALRLLGCQAKALGMDSRIFGGHAICVFVENGRYGFIDNLYLERTGARRFSDLMKNLTARYKAAKWFVLDPGGFHAV